MHQKLFETAITARKMVFKWLRIFSNHYIFIFKYEPLPVWVTYIFEYIKGQDWHAICEIHFVEELSLYTRKSLAIRSRNDSSDVLCCRCENSCVVITIPKFIERGRIFLFDQKNVSKVLEKRKRCEFQCRVRLMGMWRSVSVGFN